VITPQYVRLMAAYTEWQNRGLTAAAETLADDARRAPRGAFFGSIHATLNHLLWGDQLWLHMLAGTPPPTTTDIPGSLTIHPVWQDYVADRAHTDRTMLEWAERVRPSDLEGDFEWFSGAIAAQVRRPRWALTVQLFNHGTHHRGQVHAMLTAAGARPQDSDVPFMASPHYPW
jgi:uncharacterized damage-inducible protein DinB